MTTLRQMLDFAGGDIGNGPSEPWPNCEAHGPWVRHTEGRQAAATKSDQTFGNMLRQHATDLGNELGVFVDAEADDGQAELHDRLRKAAYQIEKAAWILDGRPTEKETG